LEFAWEGREYENTIHSISHVIVILISSQGNNYYIYIHALFILPLPILACKIHTV
jgi:hypothetical protein